MADALYQERGATDAAVRADVNTRFGTADLGDALARCLALSAGHHVLDVGCGSGKLLAGFAERVGPDGLAIGLDFGTEAVADTRARGISAAVADCGDEAAIDRALAELGHADARFHAVNAAYMAYYLDDAPAAVRAWVRRLLPGGRLVVCGPAADTNQALYAFHAAATDQRPSDADTMALGFVDEVVVPAMRAAGLEVEVAPFDNLVRWPSAEAFLDYWRHTSLFVRTVPDDAVDRALARARATLESRGVPEVLKRSTVVTGRAPGAAVR